ncbi:acetyl-CoA carboxylase biotin carboxyl carrier protein subunit [Neolewinella litorea]|uniref:Acetyl-CoA carboxylase biotin carboxyl carrier protein subunit n=1 Tax=Neolewinella litorea TaxID=2562452 RepID=A0A4S4NQI6_9BACT|nr:acetyl-CoA carboxylase biotin carboxyl carrier protein subunit [Neolewinella litorea]THH41415.1 acetyl-CoA carboxylase biotin carboxyl carrier protein subunit [Neolewinella litorea]
MENLTATVADQSFDISAETLSDLNIVGPYHGKYHLIVDGESFACELIEADSFGKRLTVAIDRRRFTVALADSYDRIVQELGLATTVATTTNEVTAPMPGLILQVMVEAGTEVEAGTPLLVLEAMKMENVIKAEGAGTVKAVKVKVGEAVDKRQLLIEME